jgi:diguanylate cyclase (GGDEF)-like protein
MDQKKLMTFRFVSILESINSGVLVENEKREIILVNRAFLEMFGIDMSVDDFMCVSRDTVERTAKSIFTDEDYFIDRKDSVVAEGRVVLNEEFMLKDGRVFERDYYPVFNEDMYLGHAWIYRDVSDRKDLENKLFELAVTDELTGAYNRRRFLEELNRNIELSRRFGTALSLIMIDLDSLKIVTERFGHEAGDEVLSSIAGSILSGKRKIDILGRWGGGEFLMLLPGTGIDAAAGLAERLRIRISALKYSMCSESVTASFGVAQFQHADGENSFIKRVDNALGLAKNEGRNRVCRA